MGSRWVSIGLLRKMHEVLKGMKKSLGGGQEKFIRNLTQYLY